MKARLGFVLVILLGAQLSFCQSQNATLLVQSPDGRTVKLVWFFKAWSSDITGFDIKRKEGLQDWVRLNPEPIVPAVLARKKLSVVESDKTKESMVRAKLLKLLAEHKLQETDYKSYLQKLNNGERSVQELATVFRSDYDIALMSGFAYVDHGITRKTNYQYGLFIQGTNILLARASWSYGEIPDLNVVNEVTSKATTKGRGIQIIWNADTSKMRKSNVAGFNIYRQGIRLNAAPIVTRSNADSSEFDWFDRSAPGSIPNEFSISAESIFGIEGIIKSYTYDPADHPSTYKGAEAQQINSLGYYFKDGINVKWSFPKEYERFIKGFYIEKDNLPKGYRQVSALLEPSSRSFIDKTPSPVTGYISFRVVAVYIDRTETPGTEKIYNYFPVREPPPPLNIKAKTVMAENKMTVTLSWDPPIYGDTVTDYYRVYRIDPITENIYQLTTDEQLKENKFIHVIDTGVPATYKYVVSSISKTKAEGAVSDTITVVYPGAKPVSAPDNSNK